MVEGCVCMGTAMPVLFWISTVTESVDFADLKMPPTLTGLFRQLGSWPNGPVALATLSYADPFEMLGRDIFADQRTVCFGCWILRQQCRGYQVLELSHSSHTSCLSSARGSYLAYPKEESLSWTL